MSRSIALLVAASALLAADSPSEVNLSKYKKVEAYEIRPGILMMPVYNAKRELCEIGLQPRSYSPGVMRLGYGFPKDVVFQIFEDLVPTETRGPQPANLIARSGIFFSGHSANEYEEYENVSIHMGYGFSSLANEKHPRKPKKSRAAQSSQMEYEAASLQFKKHPCKLPQ